MSPDQSKDREKVSQDGLFLVLTGFSGSGKDELMKKLLSGNFGFERIVTHTSRPMRDGEVEGVDYHFVTKEKFEKMRDNGEFLEHVSYGGDYKGTHKSVVSSILEGKKLIWRIDMSRAAVVHETFREVFGEEGAKAILVRTKVVLITPGQNHEVSKRRMQKRDGEKFDETEYAKRMTADLEVLSKHKFENVIHNEDGMLGEAFNALIRIIGEESS